MKTCKNGLLKNFYIKFVKRMYLPQDGSIRVPPALQPYMNGMTVIEKPDQPLILRWNKLTNTTRRQAKQS